MVLLGCFQAVQGLVAVFDDVFYHDVPEPDRSRYVAMLGKHPAEMERIATDLQLGPSEWTGHFRSFALPTSLTTVSVPVSSRT